MFGRTQVNSQQRLRKGRCAAAEQALLFSICFYIFKDAYAANYPL